MAQTEWIISIDDDLKDFDELFVGNVRDGEWCSEHWKNVGKTLEKRWKNVGTSIQEVIVACLIYVYQ